MYILKKHSTVVKPLPGFKLILKIIQYDLEVIFSNFSLDFTVIYKNYYSTIYVGTRF